MSGQQGATGGRKSGRTYETKEEKRLSTAVAPSSSEGVSSATRQFDREEAFFGFHPVKYIDEVINAVNQYACDAADSLEQSLRAALARKSSSASSSSSSSQPLDAASAEALAKGTDQVLKILQKAIDKNYDLWELYVLKNTFVVPPEFSTSSLLKSDEEGLAAGGDHQQRREALGRTSADLDQDIEHLQRRILAVPGSSLRHDPLSLRECTLTGVFVFFSLGVQTKYINEMLSRESEALDSENSRLEEHLKSLERLSARVAEGGRTSSCGFS